MKVKLKQTLTLTIEAGEVVNVSAGQYKHIAQFVEIVEEQQEKSKSRKVKKVIEEE